MKVVEWIVTVIAMMKTTILMNDVKLLGAAKYDFLFRVIQSSVCLSVKSADERQNMTTEINEILKNIRLDLEREFIRVPINDESGLRTVHDLSITTRAATTGCLPGQIPKQNEDCGRMFISPQAQFERWLASACVYRRELSADGLHWQLIVNKDVARKGFGEGQILGLLPLNVIYAISRLP